MVLRALSNDAEVIRYFDPALEVPGCSEKVCLWHDGVSLRDCGKHLMIKIPDYRGTIT